MLPTRFIAASRSESVYKPFSAFGHCQTYELLYVAVTFRRVLGYQTKGPAKNILSVCWEAYSCHPACYSLDAINLLLCGADLISSTTASSLQNDEDREIVSSSCTTSQNRSCVFGIHGKIGPTRIEIGTVKLLGWWTATWPGRNLPSDTAISLTLSSRHFFFIHPSRCHPPHPIPQYALF